MWYGESDPVGVVFFGGVKINAMENTATFSVGDKFFNRLTAK
jgi:hypothetical protein